MPTSAREAQARASATPPHATAPDAASTRRTVLIASIVAAAITLIVLTIFAVRRSGYSRGNDGIQDATVRLAEAPVIDGAASPMMVDARLIDIDAQPPTDPTCSQLVAIVPAAVSADRRAQTHAALFERCTTDRWSTAVIACYVAAAPSGQAACLDQLTVAQRRQLDRAVAINTPAPTPTPTPAARIDAGVPVVPGTGTRPGPTGWAEVSADSDGEPLEGATVTIDGKRVGTTPWAGSVSVGQHTVVVSAPGHKSARDTFTVEEESTATASVSLTKI
jgi:hypothetical protein